MYKVFDDQPRFVILTRPANESMIETHERMPVIAAEDDYPYCNSVNEMKEKNRQDFYGTREEAIAMGYKPCGACNP